VSERGALRLLRSRHGLGGDDERCCVPDMAHTVPSGEMSKSWTIWGSAIRVHRHPSTAAMSPPAEAQMVPSGATFRTSMHSGPDPALMPQRYG
jgi:hypothetical protein